MLYNIVHIGVGVEKRKKLYESRKRFNLLIEEALYSEIEGRSKQRFMSMTAYITKAIIKWIENERRFDEK
jgi:hypothetical protein